MELSAQNLTITAQMKGSERSTIVSGLSFSVPTGKKLAIVGGSGSGKTMSALAILGLLPENCTASGSVKLGGTDLLELSGKARRKLLGREMVLIPQSGADFLNPSRTVGYQFNENLAALGVAKAERKERALTLLRLVGFEQPERVLVAYPFQLSGGMAQRVVTALAALGSPKLVIADEPTRGIDKALVALFLHNLQTLFADSAVLLITHDISVAEACDDIFVMHNGKMEEYGSTAATLANPQSAYTRRLLADLPAEISVRGGAA